MNNTDYGFLLPDGCDKYNKEHDNINMKLLNSYLEILAKDNKELEIVRLANVINNLKSENEELHKKSKKFAETLCLIKELLSDINC